ncbi:hypothetical protein OEA41_005882 [Lepraria neglecta]|uniref:Uncharacterized protein n=1 Tax=Lepraria neglecta TaxID=209136 RepID=A0AAD9Z6L1_9LECA|nr:hypothetical protein OEA41_005882 [Lepraria neglecta]
MQFINHLSALAILAGPITHVLAAQTIEQITIAIQDLTNSINRANDYANGVNVLNGETIVTNNDNITTMIIEDIDALVGTATMMKDDNDALLEAINPLADALQPYFDTLGDKAKAFLAKSQKEAVQTSADELEIRSM